MTFISIHSLILSSHLFFCQVNSYFLCRLVLTFNIYYYLFLYLYITRITINNGTAHFSFYHCALQNNGTAHLKSPKNQNRRAALGRPAIKLLGWARVGGGLQLICSRPTLALSSALVPQTLSCSVYVEDF